MFSAFTDTLGNPSYNAVLEQTTMNGAIYWNARSRAEDIIATCGGGQIIVWQFQPDALDPSWVLFRQGNNLYFSFTGTVNFAQLSGDIVGAFASDYEGFGCRVHSFFNRNVAGLTSAISDNLPADLQSCNFFWVGHSYGAAVAFLLSAFFARRLHGVQHSFLGLALPKALTRGYIQALPSPCIFLSNEGDVIPQLPSNGVVQVLIPQSNVVYTGIPIDWTHYARGYTLNRFGVIGAVDPSTFEGVPAPSDVSSTFTQHPIGAYMAAAERGWGNAVGSGQNAPLLGISAAIRALPAVHDFNVNVNLATVVNIPEQNAQIFMAPEEAPLNAQNIAQVQSIIAEIRGATPVSSTSPRATARNQQMAVKITYFYAVNLAGFSESFYIGASGSGAVTKQNIQDYLQARMGISAAETNFQYCRVSTVGQARNALVFTPGSFNGLQSTTGTYGGGGRAQKHTDFGGTALLVSKSNGGGGGRMFLRGLPDEIIDTGGLYQPTPGFAAAFTAYVAQVKTLGYQYAGSGGGALSAIDITAIAQAAGSTIMNLTLGANLFQVGDVGKTKSVRITGKNCPTVLKGPRVVTVKSPNTCSLSAGFSLISYDSGSARMYMPVVGYVAISDMSVLRVCCRRPGIPFGVYHGKSRRKR